MKKEIIYLSSPDFFNKFLLSNYNQRFSLKDSSCLRFKFNTKHHLGSAIKAIYLLEIIFPRKPKVLKIVLKQKKKIFFGQKQDKNISFKFDLTLSSIDFLSFFRFFCKYPFDKNKSDNLLITNRKLKQFEFNRFIFLLPHKVKNSFFFFKLYHLN